MFCTLSDLDIFGRHLQTLNGMEVSVAASSCMPAQAPIPSLPCHWSCSAWGRANQCKDSNTLHFGPPFSYSDCVVQCRQTAGCKGAIYMDTDYQYGRIRCLMYSKAAALMPKPNSQYSAIPYPDAYHGLYNEDSGWLNLTFKITF